MTYQEKKRWLLFTVPKPFAANKAAVSDRELISASAPPEYPIAIIGRAISLAGSANMKPQSTFPSIPKSLAKGSSTEAAVLSTVSSPI